MSEVAQGPVPSNEPGHGSNPSTHAEGFEGAQSVCRTVLVNFHSARIEGLDEFVLGVASANKVEISAEAAEAADKQRAIDSIMAGGGSPREGRGDTGTQVFGRSGLKNVALDSLVVDLRTLGYRAVAEYVRVEPFLVNHKAVPGETKYVVRVSFSNDVAKPEVGGLEERFSRFLRKKCWAFCHVWLNKGATDTVNLAGGLRGGNAARQRLRLRGDREYYAEPIR